MEKHLSKKSAVSLWQLIHKFWIQNDDDIFYFIHPPGDKQSSRAFQMLWRDSPLY